MTDHPDRGVPARRWFGPTVLLGLVGAVLTAVAGNADWARATGNAAGIRVVAVVPGSEAAPLVTALALVALAAWGVLLVTRGTVRRVVAVLGAAASLGALVAVLVAFGDAHDAARAALAGKGASGGAAATLTGWYYTAGVGALVALLASAAAVVLVPRWPAMGEKYDAPAARAEQPVTDQDMWRALDRGHDPTS